MGLLETNQTALEAVAAWLKKTDRLHGNEVEDLVAGKIIRQAQETNPPAT